MPLQYVGRAPDSDATIAPKSYVDTQYNVLAVTPAVVNSRIATAAANLTTPAYVDQQDALRAHKTDVNNADNNYVQTGALGVPNGLAQLDGSGFLPAAAIPAGIVTDKVARCYSIVSPAGELGGTPAGVSGAVGSIQLTGQHTVNTTVPREYQIATIPVEDPGFPWRPLPFAWVRGKAGGAIPSTRHTGNNNYGLLTVLPPPEVGSTVYGIGICTASPYFNLYPVLPAALVGQTPTTIPAVQGALELRLYGSCWSGSSFIFSPTNLVYFILVVAAL